MIRSHHVVVRIDKEASGLTYTVPRICQALREQEIETILHVTHPIPNDYLFEIKSYPHLKYFDNIGISPEMFKALKCLKNESVIIHNHSLWTMPNVYAGLVARGGKAKQIFSPHGTLSEWALRRSKWEKKLFWFLGQKYALERTNCFHATSELELEDIRSLGYKQPVAVIPLGVDLPDINQSALLEKNSQVPYTLLFLARLHPKKGLELLLNVWSSIQDKFPDWQLIIAGPEDVSGYNDYLGNLIKVLNCKRTQLIGAVYGQEKINLYKRSNLYILPTYSENFGITVAEALSCEVPVIVTKGAPWQGVEINECGWWVDVDEQEIQIALEKAMSLTEEERKKMGSRGREWITFEFSWKQVGQKLGETYLWMLGKADQPSWVYEE